MAGMRERKIKKAFSERDCVPSRKNDKGEHAGDGASAVVVDSTDKQRQHESVILMVSSPKSDGRILIT
jgi:hypothetical protein